MKNKIKVGQIYKVNKANEYYVFVITRIKKEDVYFVSKTGYAKERDKILIENDIEDKYIQLIGEYSSWQEAVNSPEFKGEK